MTRNAYVSIFHFYAPHVLGNQLSLLSVALDEHLLILEYVERGFQASNTAATCANGLSVKCIFCCLLLKQILNASYRKLSFHLPDSAVYRTFARLNDARFSSRSSLRCTNR